MKFVITDWIKSGDILPLQWGNSLEQLAEIFPGSSTEIASLKRRGYPFIIFDFVEFYFTDDKNFLELEEIVIKAVSLYSGITTQFFDHDWLTDDLAFEFVSKKLTEMRISWYIERGPHCDTPNIRTSTGVVFAFDRDRESDSDAVLQKIYLRK